MNGYKKERKRVLDVIGYYPDFKDPKSFNEKILWKKIYDRNPLLPVISDKYRVRDYLKDILGNDEAEKLLVPLLFVTDKPDNIPFDLLTGEYVIKPNHASGMIIIAENIEGGKRFTIIENGNKSVFFYDSQTRSKIIDTCKDWLLFPYGFQYHEWAYQKIKRKIVVEKLLRNNDGSTPLNYNFFIFQGKCHLITVFYERFNNKSVARYTPEWKYLNVKAYSRLAEYHEKPQNLQYMLNLAQSLGKPFDFIRVDLIVVDNLVFFSELTSYHKSGKANYNPVSFDFELGSKWKIAARYWEKNNF